ncbi:MAG: ParA family protein [Planctomycetota bacterium]
MLIAVVNQKGGVGKTTLAVHLAVWLHERGNNVAFIDADGQSSSSRWIQSAERGITLVRETDADAIIEQAQILRRNHDLVVADGPANLADSTRALLLVADFALVPCGVTVPELESTADTIRILCNAQAVRPPGLPPATVVLGRLRDDRFSLTREAPEAAQTLGLPVCRHVLRLREALADAPGQRTVVWRMGYRAKAATTEMQNVIMEVMRHGQEATKHDRYAHSGTAGVSACA